MDAGEPSRDGKDHSGKSRVQMRLAMEQIRMTQTLAEPDATGSTPKPATPQLRHVLEFDIPPLAGLFLAPAQ